MSKYSKMVKTLSKKGDDILAEMDGNDANLMHMAIGVCGEAGELLDAVKKKVIYRKDLDRENVVEELGDLEFFLEGIRQALKISRAECLKNNIKKLNIRYKGLKYSNKAAKIRADKQ